MLERLAHAGLDPEAVDLAHRPDLRVELLEQLALSLVERAHADERDPARLDRRQRPAGTLEPRASETERCCEHHAVHIAARGRSRRVEVTVRVDPDDTAGTVNR